MTSGIYNDYSQTQVQSTALETQMWLRYSILQFQIQVNLQGVVFEN